MVVPWSSLSEDALVGIIEDFVTREGTEYGASDISLECGRFFANSNGVMYLLCTMTRPCRVQLRLHASYPRLSDS